MGDAQSRHRIVKHDPDTVYVTAWEMSTILGLQPASLSRWLKEWRIGGVIPIRRQGPQERAGWSIPIVYALVGRGWLMTQEPEPREAMLNYLPLDPKPWIVTVGNQGVTCYTAEEASQEVTKVLTRIPHPYTQGVIQVFYVGEVPDAPTKHKKR